MASECLRDAVQDGFAAIDSFLDTRGIGTAFDFMLSAIVLVGAILLIRRKS